MQEAEAWRDGEAGNELVAINWTKAGFWRALASYFIQDELPFRHVQRKGFREYSLYMNTNFFAPSRITVTKDNIKLHEEEKKKLMKVLQPYWPSITTDYWTSIQKINYMAVTTHWINDEWNLQRRIISFLQVPNHKGETIAQELINYFNEWA